MANLMVGSRGSDVLSLQKQLNAANKGKVGYVPLVEDGIFGAKTQSAVTNYQKANNLKVDGIAGVNTMGSLSKIPAKSTVLTTTKPEVKKAVTVVDDKKVVVDTGKSNTNTGNAINTGNNNTSNLGNNNANNSGNITNSQTGNNVPAEEKTVNTNAYNYFGNAVEKWVNPNKGKIDSLINDLLGVKPFDVNSWDAEKDAGFQQFKKKNIELGNKAYDSNVAAMSVNGLADSSIGRQVAETGRSEFMNRIQDAIPDFVNQARNDYNKGIQNKYDQLNMLEGQANTEYGQWQNQQQMDRTARNDYTDNTGYMPINTIPENDPLRAYSGNYQLEINKRRAVNPNDPTIPVLEQLRAEKIAGDPMLQKKYGTTMPMGMETVGSKQQGISNQAAAAKAQQDAASFALDQKYKEAQINNMQFDNNIAQEKLGISKSKAATTGTGKKLTPSQQETVNYEQFKTKFGNENGEDLYHYIVDGKSGLKSGTSSYNKAVDFAREKYYQKIVSNFNNNAYKDLAATLYNGAFNNKNYYFDVLGEDRFNKLVSMANKKKSDSGKYVISVK